MGAGQSQRAELRRTADVDVVLLAEGGGTLSRVHAERAGRVVGVRAHAAPHESVGRGGAQVSAERLARGRAAVVAEGSMTSWTRSSQTGTCCLLTMMSAVSPQTL